MQSAGTNGRLGYCLDTTDLFLSKATAGRDKDREFCMALLMHGHVTPTKVLELVPLMPRDKTQHRQLRATIRRWVKTLREEGHDIPEA